MSKIKIVLSAIIGALLFLAGIFAGKSGHNKAGTTGDISTAGQLGKKERKLGKRLRNTESKISDELDSTRTELDGLTAGSQADGNRKPSKKRSFSEIRKRNGLE